MWPTCCWRARRAGSGSSPCALRYGAGRLRLARQIVTESLLLGVAAGALGIALAGVLLRSLIRMFPDRVPFLDDSKVSLPLPALAITVAAVLLTTLLCALPTCLDLWRSNLIAGLHASSRSVSANRSTNRTRAVLIAFEVALSVVLLTGAGLMLRSLSRLMEVHLGFQPENVLTARVSAPSQLKSAQNWASTSTAFSTMCARVPGVRSTAIVTILPAWSVHGYYHVHRGGRAAARLLLRPPAIGKPGLFSDPRHPSLLRGRTFQEADDGEQAHAAIVNDELARHYWPNEDPIGKRVSRAEHPNPDEWLSVVGVVDTTRHRGLDRPAEAEFYQPFKQDATAARATSLVVRTQGDPLALASTLSKRIHQINPDQPVTEVKAMETWVREATAQPRFHTVQLEIFAALALMLAVSGVFAVVSYGVTQRTHEIGIRTALGATVPDIVRFVA